MLYLFYAMVFGIISCLACIALGIKTVVDMLQLDKSDKHYEETFHTQIVTLSCCLILSFATALAAYALRRDSVKFTSVVAAIMRALFATVIGVFSCLFGIGLGIECLIRYLQLDNSDGNYEMNAITLLITLILALIMALLSGLMVHGVRKNRHGCIIPWLIFEGLGTFCSFVNLLLSGFIESSGSVIFWRVCFIVIGVLIWYPVYTLWRDIRKSKAAVNQQSPPYEPTVVNYTGEANENLNIPPPENV